MYIKDAKTISDVGKYLVSGITLGYSLPSDVENIEEKEINLDDMELRTSTAGYVNAHCTDGLISFWVHNPNEVADYGKIKSMIILEHYTEEGQEEIPKDESNEEYFRLQGWSEFADKVVEKIKSIS